MSDPYNQAVDIHDQMAALIGLPAQFARELLKVIALCQVAIHQRPQHSRAHTMLADAYITAAQLTRGQDGYEYFLVMAVAMIEERVLAPTTRPVRNSDALRFLFNQLPTPGRKREDDTAVDVSNKITEAMLEWFCGPDVFQSETSEVMALARELRTKLHERFIAIALDPTELTVMRRVLGVAAT